MDHNLTPIAFLPHPPPSDETFKKTYLYKWFLFAVGLIILILLGIGSYTGYFFLNLNKQVYCTTEAKVCPDGSSVGRTGPKCEFAKCLTVSPIPHEIELPTLTASETANWKTYSSKSYLVKYPSTWIVESQINKNGQAIRIFNPSSMKDGYGNSGFTGIQVATEELLISIILTNQTANQFIDSIAPSVDPQSLYQAFLNGRKTLVINGYTAEIYPDVGEGSTGDNLILNNNSGVLVNIHVVGNYSLGILQQILSTFKFM